MPSKTDRKKQYKLIENLENHFNSMSRTEQMSDFKKVLRIGTNDDIIFINAIQDIADSFELADDKIEAFRSASLISTDGSACQSRMFGHFVTLVDAVDDINYRIKKYKEIGYKSKDGGALCNLASKKWIENAEQIKKHSDKNAVILNASNKTTTFKPLDPVKAELGERTRSVLTMGEFGKNVRLFKKKMMSEMDKEIEASRKRRMAHENNEDLTRMDEYAASLNYTTDIESLNNKMLQSLKV